MWIEEPTDEYGQCITLVSQIEYDLEKTISFIDAMGNIIRVRKFREKERALEEYEKYKKKLKAIII